MYRPTEGCWLSGSLACTLRAAGVDQVGMHFPSVPCSWVPGALVTHQLSSAPTATGSITARPGCAPVVSIYSLCLFILASFRLLWENTLTKSSLVEEKVFLACNSRLQPVLEEMSSCEHKQMIISNPVKSREQQRPHVVCLLLLLLLYTCFFLLYCPGSPA